VQVGILIMAVNHWAQTLREKQQFLSEALLVARPPILLVQALQVVGVVGLVVVLQYPLLEIMEAHRFKVDPEVLLVEAWIRLAVAELVALVAV
jgi:hypothetical protein